MLIKIYKTSENIEYKFCLTFMAKIELEKFRNNSTSESAAAFGALTDEERELINESMRLKEELDKEDLKKNRKEQLNAEIQNLMPKVAPIMAKLQSNALSDDEINREVAWILFNNYKETRGKGKEAFNDVLDTIEEEAGLEFLVKFLEEIKEKVFQFLDNLK